MSRTKNHGIVKPYDYSLYVQNDGVIKRKDKGAEDFVIIDIKEGEFIEFALLENSFSKTGYIKETKTSFSSTEYLKRTDSVVLFKDKDGKIAHVTLTPTGRSAFFDDVPSKDYPSFLFLGFKEEKSEQNASVPMFEVMDESATEVFEKTLGAEKIDEASTKVDEYFEALLA